VNSNGVRGLYFSSDSNNSISNINFKDNLQNNIVNTSSLREVEVNNEISLNFYVAHLNETINSNFEYNIAIYPNVSYETSTNSNVLILNFTPIKQGVYTIKLNISDSENNLEQSNFLFLIGDTSSDLVRYYLHEDEPTHGQPLATTNYDSGSMFTYPTESEEERHCGSWVQYQPDKITNFYPIIKNISLGLFYTASLSISSGLQNYATYGIDMDYIQALPVSSDYFFNITNFIDLNISSDYSWRLYWLAFKLGEISASPSVKSNATQQSYADLTYVYAGPKIEQFSEESGSDMRNVEILSSVFNDITKKKCYLGI